jgi:hypothetical protein
MLSVYFLYPSFVLLLNLNFGAIAFFCEITGGSRKLHNEEIYDLYSSPSIIRMISAREMRWAGRIVSTGEKRNARRKETNRKT